MVARGAGSQGSELDGKGSEGVPSCTEGKRKRDSCDTGALCVLDKEEVLTHLHFLFSFS